MTLSVRINMIFILSLAAILFSACQQVELPNETATQDTNDIVYAAIEDTADTKTSLDGEKVVWNSGDEIVVFKGKTLPLKYIVSASSVGTTEGYFKKDADYELLGPSSAISHNVAFYPFAEITCKAEGQSCILENISLPSVQTYVPDSFGPNSFPMMAVSADTDDVDFRFKNLCGALKLQLQGEGIIKSITIKGNSDEILAGPASVTMSRGEEPSISLASDGLKEVTLDCSEGVSLNADTPTSFLIALPPTVFSNGFTVKVTDTWGSVREFSTTKKNNISRSRILRMPVKEYIGTQPQHKCDYVDEYGINHGQGIEIDGVVWAPVNCGYHEVDFRYGKIYQWGRKYGQGYNGELCDSQGNKIGRYSDSLTPTLLNGPVNLTLGQSKESANIFYKNSDSPWDWCEHQNNKLWNEGTEDTPLKTEYDPCPSGWRVPTCYELKQLCRNYSPLMKEDGKNGFWFSGAVPYGEKVPKVFFPAAGSLGNYGGTALRRGELCGYWTSKVITNTVNILYFDSDSYKIYNDHRAEGYSVRCVQDHAELVPVESISLSMTSLTLAEGSSERVSATIVPSNANHQTPFWWSDNPDIATVDASGNITAVSEGKTIIIAMAGMQVATCGVTVSSSASNLKDYMDEYGINHGQGIEIDGVVWAPVNCGYHATDFKYGKLYQWGRKYGQGYEGSLYDLNGKEIGQYSDASLPTLTYGPVNLDVGQKEDKANIFYKNIYPPYDWAYPQLYNLLNSGTESIPVKTDSDPCPSGWRVPTETELTNLSQNHSSWTIVNGQCGYWFSGLSSYNDIAHQIFLPASGYRDDYDGSACYRGRNGQYWSSRPSRNTYDDYLAYYFYFKSDSVYISSYCHRASGLSVRCVQE